MMNHSVLDLYSNICLPNWFLDRELLPRMHLMLSISGRIHYHVILRGMTSQSHDIEYLLNIDFPSRKYVIFIGLIAYLICSLPRALPIALPKAQPNPLFLTIICKFWHTCIFWSNSIFTIKININNYKIYNYK